MGSNEPIYKTHTKIEAKKIRAKTIAIAKLSWKSDYQMWSNGEKSNIAIAILKKNDHL